MAVAGDPVPHLAEPGQSLDVDVDQVTGPLPLVALHRRFGLQVSQTAQSETVQRPGNGGEGGLEKPGDVTEVLALVTENDSLLQLVRIELPLLGASHAPSIRQKGWTAERKRGSQP